MRFKNILKKKENIEYVPGDVLIVRTETSLAERAYMVFRKYGMYNMLDLNSGQVYYDNFQFYDNFVGKLEKLFISIERIDNNKLELVRVED